MITKAEEKKIVELLGRGLTDPHIASVMGSLTKMKVYQVRHSLGISTEDVRENRYNTWVKLINAGVPTEEIAEFYGVKEQSIRVALWRTKKISFVDVKANLKKPKKKMMEIKDGIPNFKKLGI